MRGNILVFSQFSHIFYIFHIFTFSHFVVSRRLVGRNAAAHTSTQPSRAFCSNRVFVRAAAGKMARMDRVWRRSCARRRAGAYLDNDWKRDGKHEIL